MLGYLILLCWSEALLNNVHVLMTSVAENSLNQKYSHFCPFVTLPSQNWFDGPFEIFHCVYILAGSWQKWTWNKDDGVSRVCGEDWVQAPPCHCKSECCTSAGLINYMYLHHCQGAISLQVNKSKQSYQRTKAPNQTNVKVITYWRKKHLYLTMHKLLPWK